MSSRENPEVSPIQLYDRRADVLVEAELWDAIVEKNLADWEAEWVPEIWKLLKALNAAGVEYHRWPESRHWNWVDKTKAIKGKLANQCFSIVCENVTQAMMITDLTHRAQIDSQKGAHKVYVEYVEAAPWNRKELDGRSPRFGGCGMIMIRAAIELSKNEGFEGRIGLHSLPQSNDFYANKVGMTDLGKDEKYQNLRYFEMTPEQAEAFVMKGS